MELYVYGLVAAFRYIILRTPTGEMSSDMIVQMCFPFRSIRAVAATKHWLFPAFKFSMCMERLGMFVTLSAFKTCIRTTKD